MNDDELAGLRVNVIVRGLPLYEAKQLVEKHFGKLDWPPASGGATHVRLRNYVNIEIRVED